MAALTAEIKALSDRADHSFSHLPELNPAAADTVADVQTQIEASQRDYDTRLAKYYDTYGVASRAFKLFSGASIITTPSSPHSLTS